MRVLLIVSMLLVLAGATLPARAAAPWADVADPVFSRVDLSPIANPPIYAVAQDAAGFLWIGTPDGLWRYDGYEFRNLKASQALAPPNVESLVDDGRGSLWIGTQSSGLERLDEKSETFQAWPTDRKGRRGPRSATVIALAQMADGRWWIGGDSGLDAFDPRTQTFDPMPLAASDPTPRVEAIHVDRRQGVWVGTVRGLYYRAPGASRFRRLPLGSNERAGVFSLCEDEAGRIWVGSLNAVYVLSPRGRIIRSYESSSDASSLVPGEQWAIAEVTPGTYWIGASGGGIAILDAATQHVHRISIDRANPGALTPGQVWQFFRDRSGLIWTANDNGGLLSYNPHNRGIYELPSFEDLGIGDVGARSVAAASDGSLWLGGADEVVHIDPRSGTRRTYYLNGNPSVEALHFDANETLWIGTARGLCRLSPGASAIVCPAGTPEQLGRVFTLIDVGPVLWVGTDSGVFAWDRATGALVRYHHTVRLNSLSNDFVESLYADRRGYVWVGTANGLNRIDPHSRRVTRFEYDPHDARSLGPGQVSALVGDESGRLLAGLAGGPLDVLDTRGNVVIRRLEGAGGTFENINGLAAGAGGSIWASASSVILHIDPRTMSAQTLGPAEGVQQSHFWPLPTRASDGTAFFAGTYAVAVLAPDANATWNFSPPMVVTGLKTGHNGRDLSAEFAALDFSAPQAIRYEYRLDGYDHAWIPADATRRVATYTNLAAGDYTLQVRATNRSGVWSTHEIALKIHVPAAWYETWWFRALLALAGIAAIVAFVRARTAVLRRRAERLENLVQERTHELAEANAALEKMTIIDPLTGLHNRRFLLQRIDDEVELAIRNKSDLLFFIVDIDHFKAVNDEFGHASGDRVLEQMRERLAQVFRASDFIVRWGGEEFLVVTRGSSRDDAPEIAERLRAAIASLPFVLDGGQLLPKTASIGFAAFPFVPDQPHALAWTQVVDLADQALYIAKSGGRNAWYGLAASPGTDAAQLSKQLSSSPEDALREVITIGLPRL